MERILKIVAQHQPNDAKEAADIARIKTLLVAGHDLLNSAYMPAHITASALVIDWHSGKLLLHYHKKLKRWLQVGGHAAPGETDPATTALREAEEECGLPDLQFYPTTQPLDIDIHRIPAHNAYPAHDHLDFRYLLVTENPARVSATANESDQFAWLTVTEAIALELDNSLVRLIKKAEQIFNDKTD